MTTLAPGLRATDARRTPTALAVALALVLGLLGAVVAPAQPARADESGTISSLLNQARAGQGLGPLQRMPALDSVALDWANRMAAAATMSHNPSLSTQVPGGWSRLGENVAQGYPTGAAMHDGWWNSSGHRANILGDFTHVGVAFVAAGGTTWGVQVFAKYGASVAAPAPAAPAPAPAPAAPGPAPAAPAPAPAAPAAPAPAAAATPDPQPSVIDPLPSAEPSLVPSPSGPASASPSAAPPSGSSSPTPVDSMAPASDRDEAGLPAWTWLWVVALLLVAALGFLPLVRRRRAREGS